MKRLLVLTLLVISFNLFSETILTPRELILKTREPLNFEDVHFENKDINSIFEKYRPRSIKKLFPKDDRYFCVRFFEELDWNDLNSRAKNIAEIEYIQPNYVNKMHFYPNDPRFENQFLDMVHAEESWDITMAVIMLLLLLLTQAVILSMKTFKLI